MPHDENAVRELIDTFIEGWNSADADKLAGVFTQEADFVAITGLHARGREVIAQGHEEILATIYHGTTLEGAVERIDWIRPDVALVNAKFYLRKNGQSFFDGVEHTSGGMVAVKDNGKWQLATFRNMVPFARPIAGRLEKELLERGA